jgi:uncharacterized alkaline shock family protein YloU
MAMTAPEDHLPCGIALDDLVRQVTEEDPTPDPAHQAGCPYCQTALRGLARSWADVQALAAEPVPVPAGLTARVMSRVRTLAARMATTFVQADVLGETRISHTVIGQIARRAALTVPGVLFASAQARPGRPTDPARLILTLRLVIAFGPAADALADAVRAIVHQRIPRLTGATVSSIDITIDDIADPDH